MKKAIETAKKFFEDLYENSATIVGVKHEDEKWELLVEVITDNEYTQKRAKNDLVSVFKLYLDENLQILSYSREEIRERGKPLAKEE